MRYVFCLLIALSSTSVFADKHVKGYVRSNGTYVESYIRSNSNNTQTDNYSTEGNTNPYTGKAGTKKATK